MIRWMYHTWLGLVQRGRRARLRALGVRLADGCRVEALVDVQHGVLEGRRGEVRVGPQCYLSRGVILDAHGGRIDLGANVFLGPYTLVQGHGGVVIGDECLIASHCRVLSSNHAIPPRGVAVRTQADVLRPTRIGRDVWLGTGVTVLGGVTIGDGCVVGAGAVVTKDLPEYAVAIGVPARVVRYRT